MGSEQAPVAPAIEGSVVQTLRGHDGVDIVVESRGEGPRVVVVLPGGGQTRSRWTGVAVRLAAEGVRVVAMDLRGHGQSGWSGGGSYELEHYASDVEMVLGEIGTPVTLVGHSLGGRIALVTAPRHALVERLVLVDSVPDMGRDDQSNAFLVDTADGFSGIDEACVRMEQHFGRPTNRESIAESLRRAPDGRYYWHWDPAILRRVLGDLTDEVTCLRAAAGALRVPTLLVRTEYSQFVDDASVERLRDLVPALHVATLPRTHHQRPWARPEQMARLIIDFMP